MTQQELQTGRDLCAAIHFLKELGEEMKTQDNDCQAAPRFWVVAENKREWNIESDYADGAMVWDVSLEEYYESPQELLVYLIEKDMIDKSMAEEVAYLSFESILDLLSDDDKEQFNVCCYRQEMHVPAQDTMFLTKRECEEHIKRNSYHYCEPHTWAMTAWRSPQVERLFKTLQETNWEYLISILTRQRDKEKI